MEFDRKENAMFSYLRLFAMMPLLRAFMLLDVSMMEDGSEEITYRPREPEMGTWLERMRLLKRLWRATKRCDKAALKQIIRDVECSEYHRR